MVGRRGLIAAAAVVLVVGAAAADGHRQNRRREHGRKGSSEHAVPAVDNPAYQEACGACHFPLQPALLPSRSWRLLMAETRDHFDQALDLEAAQMAEIEAYLTANAAEKTPGALAQEIMESLGSSTPLRVTDVPVIRDEHRRLDPTVFERSSVAGRADCPACHPGATAGIYDGAEIPSR